MKCNEEDLELTLKLGRVGKGELAGSLSRRRGAATLSAGPLLLDLQERRPRGYQCLNVICVQCENGNSISPIDSAQTTMAHDADTDSDLARPSDDKHPSARHNTPAMLLRSATRRGTAGHVVAHPGPSDSE
jgi:hypothetical protein